MKLSSQHRALYCYLILSVWIFLLIAGMYKYIGNEDGTAAVKSTENEISRGSSVKILKPDIKTRRIFHLCNPPEEISVGSEGQVPSNNLSLEAILIFLRHGDRGPLSHVRNVSTVNCAVDLSGVDHDRTVRQLQQLLHNASSPQLMGPFHGFPLLPPFGGECQLGQLTAVGAAQMLKSGTILRHTYGDRLGFGNGSLAPEDILVYSTKYRRTVQSTLAFLAGLLPPEDLQKAVLHESQSLAFCFNDCACAAAEQLRRGQTAAGVAHLHSHPAVARLVKQAAAVALERPPGGGTGPEKEPDTDPRLLQDALLTYVCHAAPLPCADDSCLRMEQVTGLAAYLAWECRQQSHSPPIRRSSLLRAYGLVRAVVAQLVRVVSERRPRVAVFSGHDRTLEYLAGALGLEWPQPRYGARFVIEVYRGRDRESHQTLPRARDFFLRLVGDGRDLTPHTSFCRQRQLCPIESIIRFLHEDYFAPFNASNFKDACMGKG
ncbi:2-phosphoxylose phosphatase 1 isoform X1 [Schistocerca piceifrons]|uniref:2-phosphoxylose phosphatase 1 isoform X1 n=1 Tax=Schistocerca piceifrons TaxID=274613 RepID=UPI001F5F93B6|nr:2-phosphoxylose phosphatase 1 isoform X1 [Schistocerca piceifrons]XP_049949443.1 2-phosphoxylose phosphatase 1 isoform X1 [Schistocerca serialis cubense]